MVSEGLQVTGGPRVAGLLLRDVAKRSEIEDSAIALLAEIRRLSNIMMPASSGWEMQSLQAALDCDLVTSDDVAEAESFICFFILVSAIAEKKRAETTMTLASGLWNTQMSSLDATEFMHSLPTSSGDANSGEKVAA